MTYVPQDAEINNDKSIWTCVFSTKLMYPVCVISVAVITAECFDAMACDQGFSQKGVQPSYGLPFLEEIKGKFT